MALEADSKFHSDPATAALACHSLQRLRRSYELRQALSLPRLASCSLALLLAAPGANALELGEAAVESHLGQPLAVTIPYRAAANERLDSYCVSLVRPPNPESALPAYTNSRRITTTANRIRIFGSEAVREPLLGLNVRINCNTTPHIIRSYMLFIDPASSTAPAKLSAAPAVAPQSTPAARSAPKRTQPALPAPSARAKGQSGPTLRQGQQYRVVRGDTLSGIAARVAERPGTIWQTVDRIFDANPQAFTNGDRDLIEAGRIITIPELTARTAATQPTRTQPSFDVPAPTVTEPTIDPETSYQPELPADDAALAASADAPGTTTSAGSAQATIDIAPAVPAPDGPVDSGTRGVDSPFKADAPPIDLSAEEPAAGSATVDAAGPEPSLLSAEPEADTGLSTGLLSGLIAIGAGIALMFLLLVRRRHRLDESAGLADPRTAGVPTLDEAEAFDDDLEGDDATVETDYDIDAEHLHWDVTQSPGAADSGDSEEFTFSMPQDRQADLGDLDLELPDTSGEVLDLDVGAPMAAFEDEDSTIDRQDESVIIEADVGTELTADSGSYVTSGSFSPEVPPGVSPQIAGDTGPNLTVAELDLLAQDYEAEFTATQQLSPELAAAVEDLNKTREMVDRLKQHDQPSLDDDEETDLMNVTDVLTQSSWSDELQQTASRLSAGAEPTIEIPAKEGDEKAAAGDIGSTIERMVSDGTLEFNDSMLTPGSTVEMPATNTADELEDTGEPLITDEQAEAFLKDTNDIGDWDPDEDTLSKTGSGS